MAKPGAQVQVHWLNRQGEQFDFCDISVVFGDGRQEGWVLRVADLEFRVARVASDVSAILVVPESPFAKEFYEVKSTVTMDKRLLEALADAVQAWPTAGCCFAGQKISSGRWGHLDASTKRAWILQGSPGAT